MLGILPYPCKGGLGGLVSSVNPPKLKTVALFSQAVFQVIQRVMTGNLVKTVTFPTQLKLSESANFNAILLKLSHQTT